MYTAQTYIIIIVVLVLVPDGFVDTGKSPPNPDSRASGNDGQVKRVSDIRHIQMETVLASVFIFGIYIAFRSLRTRCPRCHSINTRKRRSSHRYRTHRCRQCNIAFAPSTGRRRSAPSAPHRVRQQFVAETCSSPHHGAQGSGGRYACGCRFE